jgi:glycosyltransferase involved in cell wall biosynthesis
MDTRSPEVAFYGYVFAPTGYGTAARGYVHAMHAASIPLSIVSLDREPHRPLRDPIVLSHMATSNHGFSPAVHLWHTEPNCVMKLNRSFARLAVMTTWEAESLPQPYVDALHHAAEVWVPSRFNAEAFQRQLSIPVFRLPHPVNDLPEPRYDAEAFEREMDLPRGCFLATAIGTWQERKNLDGTIEAFLRAFPRTDDAFLILKTSFAFVDERMARAQIAAAIARANVPNPAEAEKRIRIFPYQWPDDCISSLLHRADCYVSLHRGEGWCYPLFDAASIGVPVVATAYSGPMDYLDSEHHRLVGYTKTAANQRKHTIRFAFDSSMSWADPDLEHAAQQLRAVYNDRAGARRLAVAAAGQIRKNYSVDVVGEAARRRFLALSQQALRLEQESLFPPGAIECPYNTFGMPALTIPGMALDSPSAPALCN